MDKHGLEEVKKVFEATALDFDLDQILTLAVRSAGRFTKADQCFLYLVDEKKGDLVLKAAEQGRAECIGKVILKLGEGITGWVAREKKPLIITENAYNDGRFKNIRSLPEDKYEGFFSAPVLYKDKLVGVLNLQFREKKEFSEDVVDLLMILSQLIALAIENGKLAREKREMEQALLSRKLIDKAKGILMKNMKIAEDGAYCLIRKRSMDLRKPMREVAEMIIQTEDMYSQAQKENENEK